MIADIVNFYTSPSMKKQSLINLILQAIPKNGSRGGGWVADLFQRDYGVRMKGKTAASTPMSFQKLLKVALDINLVFKTLAS